MDRDRAIAILNAHATELRRRGVLHAAIFGSVARGDATLGSDLDVVIELDPQARVDSFAYAGLKQYIAELFPGRVDVVNRGFLKPHVRPSALGQAVYAF